MAITIRNEDTLKKLEVLLKKNGHRTKTGLIDNIVDRHYPHLKSELKAANELFQIKKIVRNKAIPDRAYEDQFLYACERRECFLKEEILSGDFETE